MKYEMDEKQNGAGKPHSLRLPFRCSAQTLGTQIWDTNLGQKARKKPPKTNEKCMAM
jgi:hypothetical protein